VTVQQEEQNTLLPLGPRVEGSDDAEHGIGQQGEPTLVRAQRCTHSHSYVNTTISVYLVTPTPHLQPNHPDPLRPSTPSLTWKTTLECRY